MSTVERKLRTLSYDNFATNVISPALNEGEVASLNLLERAKLGCGTNVLASQLKRGYVVLDIGSGTGVDAFACARLVGKSGKIYGLDSSEEMIRIAEEVSRENQILNVEFILGDATNIPLPDGSVDVVLSDCVLNLVDDKDRAWTEIARVLKDDGHVVYSDTTITGMLPEKLRISKCARQNCVSGAVSKDTTLSLLQSVGLEHIGVISDYSVREEYVDRLIKKDQEDEGNFDVRNLSVIASKSGATLDRLNANQLYVLGQIPQNNESVSSGSSCLIQVGSIRSQLDGYPIPFIQRSPKSGAELLSLMSDIESTSRGGAMPLPITFDEAYSRVIDEYIKLTDQQRRSRCPLRLGLMTADKLTLRKVLKTLFPSANPPFVHLADQHQVGDLTELTFPVVAKPTDDANSRNVFYCKDIKSLQEASEVILEQTETLSGLPSNKQILVEGYIAGPEYSVDVVVIDGQLEFAAFCEKTTSGSPSFVEVGHMYPAKLHGNMTADVLEIVKCLVDNLKVDRAVAHVEFKIDEGDTIKIVEINARPPGGGMAWMLEQATGVDLVGTFLKMQLEDEIESPTQSKFHAAVYKCWFTDKRAILDYSDGELKLSTNLLPRVEMDKPRGSIVFPLTHQEGGIFGRAICFGRSRDEAWSSLLEVENGLNISLEAYDGADETDFGSAQNRGSCGSSCC